MCFGSGSQDHRSAARYWLQAVWRDVLARYIAGDAAAPPPKEVSAPCCGEFSVSAARVAARPRQLYADLLAWAAKPETVSGDRCLKYSRKP